MPIMHVRIDDRLVHGQVVESWLPFIKANEVVVVSDAAAADSTQRLLMRLALPEKVRLEVLTTAQAVAFLTAPRGESERVLVLAPGPREVLALLEGGVGFRFVNIGGLHYSAGRVQLGKMIFLSEEDRLALRQIAYRGVALEGQTVPSERKTDLAELLCEGYR